MRKLLKNLLFVFGAAVLLWPSLGLALNAPYSQLRSNLDAPAFKAKIDELQQKVNFLSSQLAAIISITGGKSSGFSQSGVSEVRLTTHSANQSSPRIYGDRIVWQDNSLVQWDIYMYNLKTGVTTRITTSTANDQSPDVYGSKIVWHRWNGTDNDIYLRDVLSGGEVRVTTSSRNEAFPQIYGNKVTWMEFGDPAGPAIYLSDLTTGSRVKVANTYNPYYDFDGYQIAYNVASPFPVNIDIYLYDVATGISSRVTTSTMIDNTPTIENKKLIWVRTVGGPSGSDLMFRDFSAPNGSERILVDPGTPSEPDNYRNLAVFTSSLNEVFGSELYLYDLQTNISTMISAANAQAIGPQIYDDKVVWADWRSGDADIYMIGVVNNSKCGDLNGDGIVDVLDVTRLVDYAFRGGLEPDPWWVGDLDDDGVIGVLDVTDLANYVFRGGPEPVCVP